MKRVVEVIFSKPLLLFLITIHELIGATTHLLKHLPSPVGFIVNQRAVVCVYTPTDPAVSFINCANSGWRVFLDKRLLYGLGSLFQCTMQPEGSW